MIKNLRLQLLSEFTCLIMFFLATASFCYSTYTFNKHEKSMHQGISWKCCKCNKYIWKQDPPYNCPNCGTPKGRQ
jgi:rubrerythrin